MKVFSNKPNAESVTSFSNVHPGIYMILDFLKRKEIKGNLKLEFTAFNSVQS